MPDFDGDELIISLYRAASEPALLGAALSMMCRQLEACSATMLVERRGDPAATMVVTSGFTQRDVIDYMLRFSNRDPMLIEARSSAASRVILSQEIVTNAQMDDSELYREFSLQRTGAFHRIAARQMLSEDTRIDVTLHRTRDAPAFDEAGRTLLGRISAHLRAALALGREVDARTRQAAMTAAVLDQIAHGVVVADAQAHVLYTNGPAQLLGSAYGLSLRLHDTLRARMPRSTHSLHAIIRQACGDGRGGNLRLHGPSGALAVGVTALPDTVVSHLSPQFARQLQGTSGLALLMLRLIAPHHDLDTAKMIDLFGLTPAEAAILPHLIAGETATTVARLRGVTVPTVRSQVRSVLAKTEALNLRGLTAAIARLNG